MSPTFRPQMLLSGIAWPSLLMLLSFLSHLHFDPLVVWLCCRTRVQLNLSTREHRLPVLHATSPSPQTRSTFLVLASLQPWWITWVCFGSRPDNINYALRKELWPSRWRCENISLWIYTMKWVISLEKWNWLKEIARIDNSAWEIGNMHCLFSWLKDSTPLIFSFFSHSWMCQI